MSGSKVQVRKNYRISMIKNTWEKIKNLQERLNDINNYLRKEEKFKYTIIDHEVDYFYDSTWEKMYLEMRLDEEWEIIRHYTKGISATTC